VKRGFLQKVVDAISEGKGYFSDVKRTVRSSTWKMRTRQFLRWERPQLANSWCLVVALFCGCSAPRQAQRSTNTTVQLNVTTRAEVAEKFAQTLADDYCHADLGAKMAAAIRAKLNAKAYDAITSPSDFADALERDAHAVVADRHIEVDFNSEPLQTPTMDRDLPSIENAIPELRILDGNVGYMVVNGMLPGRAARDAIAAAFAFLHDTDALILDLRGNPGGTGIADLYMSYLSEGPPHLLETVHWRNGPASESRTIDLGDRSYGDKKPVFVLTSRWTFSAGEDLAYDIKSFKRGVVVGETTGGGANPSTHGMVPLRHGFFAQVPTGYIVSAATGANWEGVGVKPDVDVPADHAFAKALSLALTRVSASTTDPHVRTFLEALASANLDGRASLPNAQLVGTYTTNSGRPSVTILENDGKLYQRREGSETRSIVLRSLGGGPLRSRWIS
jgi:retinol-binding protein 3